MPAPIQPPTGRLGERTVVPGVETEFTKERPPQDNDDNKSSGQVAHSAGNGDASVTETVGINGTAAARPQPATQGRAPASLREINEYHQNNIISWADNLGTLGRVVGGHADGAIVSDAAATGAATHGTDIDGDVGPVGGVTPESKGGNDFLHMGTWTPE